MIYSIFTVFLLSLHNFRRIFLLSYRMYTTICIRNLMILINITAGCREPARAKPLVGTSDWHRARPPTC